MGGSLEVARRFGTNLSKARRAVGLSQEALGLRSSLHRTEVGLLERGARVPRIDTLLKLTRGLDVPVETLLDGIAWTPATAEPGSFEIATEDGP